VISEFAPRASLLTTRKAQWLQAGLSTFREVPVIASVSDGRRHPIE
jgi:hypothetical protein